MRILGTKPGVHTAKHTERHYIRANKNFRAEMHKKITHKTVQKSKLCTTGSSPYVVSSSGFYRRDGVVLRASALQSVDPGFISPSRVIPKDFKKCCSQLSCSALSTKEMVWSTGRQACLLSLGKATQRDASVFVVADRGQGQVLYSSW